MSAAEIINVIKAINHHVTKKYCDAIYGYLTEQSDAHSSFERQFFNTMDQAVQRLINDITNTLTPISSSHILQQIQKHCNKYNQHKQTMYDNHLAKLREFDKKFIDIIQLTLKEKVSDQNNLIDAALQTPGTQQIEQNVTQDLINLLTTTQNVQNAQYMQNAENQMLVDQAPNPQTLQNINNVLNIQNIQNAIYSMNNSQTSPTQTQNIMTNNMNKLNQLDQINQFLSIVSQATQNNDNTLNDNSTISAHNDRVNMIKKVEESITKRAGVGKNNQLTHCLPQNIVNNINMNALSQSQNNNINSNNYNNSMTSSVFPSLPSISSERQNCASNNREYQYQLQLKNLIAPIHYGYNKAPLPIQPRKIPTLTIPTTIQKPAAAVMNNISTGLSNSTANILPSFPFNNIEKNNTITVHNNINAWKNDNVTSQNSGNDFVTNGIGAAQVNVWPTSNIKPTDPPKPPPPPTLECVESSPDAASICCEDNDNDSNHRYECTFCNKDFDTPQEWKSHLKKSHFKADKKKKKSKKVKNSKQKRSKEKRKRVFSKMNKSDDDSGDNNTLNKRRRQKFQCEYCDKQYSRVSAYMKHYNHHMITNENNICNFCLCQFKYQIDLKKHIDAFGAGMTIQDGSYQCCQCAMKFANKKDVQAHINCDHTSKNKDAAKGLEIPTAISLGRIIKIKKSM